ncbi:hypothetical protein BH09BAC1_BH09BAC1_02120 [soil metagenome]
MDRDYYEDIVDEVEQLAGNNRFSNIYRFVFSIIIYFVTYNIMYILGGMFMAAVAAWIGFEPEYKFMGVYNLPTRTQDWHRWLVLAVYSAFPIFGIISGLVIYWLSYLMWQFNTIIKVFLLWMAVHGLTFFGSYAIASVLGTNDFDSPFYYGFSAAASWFHLDEPFMVPLTLIGILFMTGCGLFFIRGFLNLAYSRKVAINYNTRRKFLLQVITGPWIVGGILCIFTIWVLRPDTYDFNRIKVLMPHLVHHASILFLVVGTIFRLDYIVGGIEVHSFDVFKGRIWIGVMCMVAIAGIIYVLQRFSLHF